MDNSPPTGDVPSQERLLEARRTFVRILRALNMAADRLESGEDTKTDATARQDLYRLYIKQLQTVFDIEGSLKTDEKTTAGRDRIDLDAARHEIRERLCRIRDQTAD